MFSCCPPERPITKLYATLFKAVSLLQNQMPLSLLYWRAQRWIWSCPWVSLALGRAEGSPPMMCWQRLAQYSPGDAVGLCSKGTLLACLRVVVHQDPRVFFFFFWENQFRRLQTTRQLSLLCALNTERTCWCLVFFYHLDFWSLAYTF